ncbi:MAG: hypothetical protein IT350_06120 [Deltaproteobacteria bacterium]|nr:hypothetical protein [Deltaproteobacteria bacterium]
MTVHIYSDFAAGNDAWDGSQATSGGGSIGPKKHINAAKALVTNPVEDEVIIHVAGDTANPGNRNPQRPTGTKINTLMADHTTNDKDDCYESA